jgi:hypothetical protein
MLLGHNHPLHLLPLSLKQVDFIRMWKQPRQIFAQKSTEVFTSRSLADNQQALRPGPCLLDNAKTCVKKEKWLPSETYMDLVAPTFCENKACEQLNLLINLLSEFALGLPICPE